VITNNIRTEDKRYKQKWQKRYEYSEHFGTKIHQSRLEKKSRKEKEKNYIQEKKKVGDERKKEVT
jgi:hypothetical protein